MGNGHRRGDLEKGKPGHPENKNGFRNKITLDERMLKEKEHLNSTFLTAVITGKLDKAEELLLKGADVNAKDENGKTPLKFARFMGNREMIEFLESKGARE